MLKTLSAADCQASLHLSDGGIRPPLKWAGGKRWLVPHLRNYWHALKRRRLVEPFCGGLAVALGLLPHRALLSDINPHSMHFYRWLKKGLQYRCNLVNSEKFYYSCRERFNELISSGRAHVKEAAVLFYYLNRTGYNGLCRFNQQGGFNVPFGRYKNINYLSDFTPYKEIFSDWDFLTADFEELDLRADDLIYADPPYDVQFTQYARQGFSWEDQMRLAHWLCRHQGPVILSNQATERIVRLYKDLGFRLHFLQAPRMINCTGDRSPAEEVLAVRGL
jgi:DNA adenine methylase